MSLPAAAVLALVTSAHALMSQKRNLKNNMF